MNNEKLLELVREYTFLYDISDRRYSDSQKKDAAWMEIARKLKVHEKDCKRAWALLRDAFRRAVKKQKEAKAGGQPNAIVKKWKYEDEMSFLLPYLKERATVHTVSSQDDDSMPSLFLSAAMLPPDEASQGGEVASTSAALRRPSKRQRRLMQSVKAARRAERPSTVLMKYILENKRHPDDVEQFFAGMATTVKSFPPQQRARAKARVFEVVSQMEMALLASSAADQSLSSNASVERSPFDEYQAQMPELPTTESKTNVAPLF